MKSLYVHIPFCLKKCLFCSFAISVGARHRIDEYLDAIEVEIKKYKDENISTIYFGGGTPTFLNSKQLSRLCNAIKNNFLINDKTIWSIEANPEDFNESLAHQLKALGFDRVSLGVQTFNDTYLKFLGRAHDSNSALRAHAFLLQAGIGDINIDLMYGFPNQSREELAEDLKKVTELKPQHVSIYTLTIEPNSRFYAKSIKLDGEEKLADDYVYVTNFLETRGLKQYEVSNFACLGYESRHNMVYWQGGDYIGIGMGAHGLQNDRRYWNEDTLSKYIEAIKDKGVAVQGEEILSTQIRLTEKLIFGLRMNKGVCIADLERESGVSLTADQHKTIRDLTREGFLEVENNFLRSTLKGRLVLDDIAVRLV